MADGGNGDTMFAPLPEDAGTAAATVQDARPAKVPIIPVPADAPQLQFRHRQYGAATSVHEYRLATGELAGYVARFEIVEGDGNLDKQFLPITYCDLGDGRRGWSAKGIPAPRPLYNLVELVARPDAPVLVVEGEKTADAAKALFLDFVVITSMHGAKSPAKTDWSPLATRNVTIWPDNDDEGKKFADTVAGLARSAGAQSIAIVEIPADWPAKWDLADPLPHGVDEAMLRDMLDPAVEPQPPPEPCYVSFGNFRMSPEGLFYVERAKRKRKRKAKDEEQDADNKDEGEDETEGQDETEGKDETENEKLVCLSGPFEVRARVGDRAATVGASCCGGTILTGACTNGRCQTGCWAAST